MPVRNTFNTRPVPKQDMKVRDAMTDVASFTYDEDFLEAAKKRISFWREYPFHMSEHYLGIKLKPFQCILLYQMFHNTNFCFIASRGLGKTFLTAVMCICKCILYPGTKVVVASGVKSQAYEVFDKINDLYRDSPMLREEIFFKTESKQSPYIEFKNGSNICSVTANDNSRGKRCHLLVLDEFRMIDRAVVDAVLRKFKANSRHPKYLDLKECQHLAESNQEVLLTSAWLKNHWSYDRYMSTIKQMASGKPYFCCNLPYQISVRNGLKKKEDIINEMTELDFDPVKWKIEMEGQWLGESENALFDADTLNGCRRIEKAIYPIDVRNQCKKDHKKVYEPKGKDEIRYLSGDIALMSSKRHKNDASCFAIFRLLKNSANNDYLRDVIYIETCTGQHSEAIALRMRKLFEEYECDYMVMDAHGLGLPIFDLLVGNAIVDESTGTEYYPLACMNNDELNERCLYPNNPKVIYAIKASAQLNSDMAICLQNSINTRKFRLLENESEGKEYITRFSEYDKFSGDLIGKLKSPYVQTTLAIYEMLTLEAERKDDGKIRVREQSGKRKDRYSAIVMGNYFATELARKNFKKNIEADEEDEYVLSFGFD